MERETVIKIENVKKQYRLGTIGGGTLRGDLQSWWARKRGKEDPNLKIGQEAYTTNEKFYALNGISFEVYKGERLGIIGGNGAGKSTTLKLLSRVTAPTEGNIYIKGRISSMLEVGTGFHPELTGRENIYLNGAILGMSKAEVDSKIEDIIDFSECRKFIDTPVKRYSSGMYVKLAFSVAAHLDSEVLIMDEVLAVGDMKFQQKCLKKMSEVAEKEGRTVLYVSHNMNTIRQLCDRCIVLDHGKVLYTGDVESAINIYRDMYEQDALDYLTVADDLAAETDNSKVKGYVSSSLAKAYDKFGEPQEALKSYSKAVKHYAEADSPLKVAQNYMDAADIMIDYNCDNKARGLLQKAKTYAQKTGDNDLINSINEKLAKLSGETQPAKTTAKAQPWAYRASGDSEDYVPVIAA